MYFLSSLAVAAVLATSVSAHPGHDVRHEIEARAAFMTNSKRDLSHCAAKMKARGLDQSSIQRRAAIAKAERKKRGLAASASYLKARSAATVLNTTHLSSVDYTDTTDESVIFSGNNTCILSPEVTQGPYYVSGEYVRENITEDQAGVELILDTQIIDMATCDPVSNAMIEIWHCNSTGVYSGIVASGNGDSSDASNINATFLRGLQQTDSLGVAKFATLFPGHYTGRAPHVHVLAHFNGTTHENGTYTGGYVSHVGQLFFDQSLITEVELTSPYSTNTQDLTTNTNDTIFSEEAASSDPVVEYSLLGESVSDGIFAWIAFGINLTSEYTITPAATLYASGGVESSSSSGGPAGNSTSGNFTGGSPPS